MHKGKVCCIWGRTFSLLGHKFRTDQPECCSDVRRVFELEIWHIIHEPQVVIHRITELVWTVRCRRTPNKARASQLVGLGAAQFKLWKFAQCLMARSGFRDESFLIASLLLRAKCESFTYFVSILASPHHHHFDHHLHHHQHRYFGWLWFIFSIKLSSSGNSEDESCCCFKGLKESV